MLIMFFIKVKEAWNCSSAEKNLARFASKHHELHNQYLVAPNKLLERPQILHTVGTPKNEVI